MILGYKSKERAKNLHMYTENLSAKCSNWHYAFVYKYGPLVVERLSYANYI